MSRGKIIFLNGTSSAGKSTLTRKLQEVFDEPFFHLSIDAFENMAPAHMLEDNFWPVLQKAASAMHHSIATFSDLGFNVIVDHVLIDMPEEQDWLPECARVLRDYPALFVGVHCPLHELERREQERGDREIGQAKWQLPRVHAHGLYDLEVNTHEQTGDEIAELVKAKLAAFDPKHGAFRKLHERFEGEQDVV